MTRSHRRLVAIVSAAACTLLAIMPALSIFVAPACAAEEEARVLILNGLDPLPMCPEWTGLKWWAV